MIENWFWKGVQDFLSQFESALFAENSDTYTYGPEAISSIQGLNVALVFR
jgi:hypothetical protein